MSQNKVNNKLDFRNVKQTQFDRGQVLKGSFSELQSALRVYSNNAILKDAYTHFIQEVDGSGRPTKVTYYQATAPATDRINFRADSGGDLAGTYFTLQEFITKKTYVFYYVVSGSGVAPGIGDVETAIVINNNDPASVVAFASREIINAAECFDVIDDNLLASYVDIEYLQFGETEFVNTGTTGFLTSRLVDGESFEVGEVELSYDVDGNPIYNGNPLKGLLYNPYTASFDVERDEVTATVDLDKPSSFTVTEISVALANTEVEIVVPNGTKKFKLQAREPNTKLTVTDVTSGDYFTIRYGSHYEDNDVKTNGVTLYVTTSRNARTLELLTWS